MSERTQTQAQHTQAQLKYKAELWTTISGAGGTHELWALVGSDSWPVAFGSRQAMEEAEKAPFYNQPAQGGTRP